MKVNKKNFTKMINSWQKKSPASLKQFFFDNILGNMRHGNTNLDKVMTDVITSNPEIVLEQMSDFMEENDILVAQSKPTTQDNYIEIECFADMDRAEALMLAVEYGVSDWVDITTDGSIEADVGTDFEFRVLIKEKTMALQLKKLAKFLKAGDFEVNESCGLHVHLDMRNRKMEQIYKRLLKFQDLMFGMVSKNRWNNPDFCAYTEIHNRTSRYVAINKNAYEKHKTLEIRVHQGTVNVKLIENWVNLLLKIINSTNPAPRSMKKDSVVKWLGKNRKLKTYVKKTYQPDWRNKIEYNHHHDDEDFDRDDW